MGFTLDEIKEAIQGLQLKALDGPSELPLAPLNVQGTTIKHLVDLVMRVEMEIDYDAIKGPMKEGRWQDLPMPLKFKKPFPEDGAVQICIIPYPDEEGVYCIVKHLVFREKVKPAFAVQFANGSPHNITWQHPKTGMKIWQYLFENLGSIQCKRWTLTPYVPRKKGESVFATLNGAEIDLGFDYIEEHGPRSTAGNKQLRWITKVTNDKETPLYQWPAGLLEKALRNLAADGAFAVKQSHFPLTLRDVNRTLRSEVLAHIVPSLDHKGLLLLGEPGVGKTPLGRTIAMAVARHRKTELGLDGVAGFRSANELEFFRGEVGHVLCPDLFDDGDSNTQPLRKVKAFFDVGEEEAMSKERWTAAKWVRGQCRIMMDNSYNGRAEPTHDGLWVSHEAFYDMVVEAFYPNHAPAHYMAIFKRANIILNSKQWLYFRVAGEEEVRVPRVKVDKLDYLNADAKPVYAAYKLGEKQPPADFAAAVAWEAQWMKHVTAKAKRGAASSHAAPLPWTVIGPNLFGGADVARVLPPAMDEPPATPAPAPPRRGFKRPLRSGTSSIDLCEPPANAPALASEVRAVAVSLDIDAGDIDDPSGVMPEDAAMGDDNGEEDVFGHGFGLSGEEE